MLALYTKASLALQNNDPQAFKIIHKFLKLGPDYFCPYVPEEPAESDMAAVEDARMYYIVSSELYHKVNLLIDMIGFDKKGQYQSLEDALTTLQVDLMAAEIEPESVKDYVLSNLKAVINRFYSVRALLAASSIVPPPIQPFETVKKALSFTFIGADTLFLLAVLGRGDRYLKSGYSSSRALTVPSVFEAYQSMLDEFREEVASRMSAGC